MPFSKEKKRKEKKSIPLCISFSLEINVSLWFDEHNVFTYVNLRNIFHILLAL